MSQDVVVYVVDDDGCARDAMRLLLMTVGLDAVVFELPLDFIEEFDPHQAAHAFLTERPFVADRVKARAGHKLLFRQPSDMLVDRRPKSRFRGHRDPATARYFLHIHR